MFWRLLFVILIINLNFIYTYDFCGSPDGCKWTDENDFSEYDYCHVKTNNKKRCLKYINFQKIQINYVCCCHKSHIGGCNIKPPC